MQKKKKEKLKIGDPVVIDWKDASSNGGWHDVGYKGNLVSTKSCGLLSHKDREITTIVQNVADNGRVSDSMTIPTKSIIKIKRLK